MIGWLTVVAIAGIVGFALGFAVRADAEAAEAAEVHPCGCDWPDSDDDAVPGLIECAHGLTYAFRAWTDPLGNVRDAWDPVRVARVEPDGAVTVLPLAGEAPTPTARAVPAAA